MSDAPWTQCEFRFRMERLAAEVRSASNRDVLERALQAAWNMLASEAWDKTLLAELIAAGDAIHSSDALRHKLGSEGHLVSAVYAFTEAVRTAACSLNGSDIALARYIEAMTKENTQ